MELGGYSVAQRRKTWLRYRVRIPACMTSAPALESGRGLTTKEPVG